MAVFSARWGELPPRTRRIRCKRGLDKGGHGTTSAYAENTGARPGRTLRTGNYLRVRGEYSTAGKILHPLKELPPRTRRIPLALPRALDSAGTTSAYAENTGELSVGGADFEELPPRTRRIHRTPSIIARNRGTTSAYAENTVLRQRCSIGVGNYLRVRGEYPWCRVNTV